MNKQESDILNALLLEPFINQRVLAEVSGHSLGVVNRSLKELIKAGYLNEAICPTAKAVAELIEECGGEVVSLQFVIELTDLPGREVLKGYNVDSVVKY